MTKKELRWVFYYALLLALLTSLPYLIGYFMESDEFRFSGFIFAVNDGNSYIAKMLSGSVGAWLFRSPYSTMEQRGVLAFLPYLLLGKLAAGSALHEQLVALYHLFRVLVTPIAVYATYQLISLFVKEIYWRRWGTILATAGGGLGWLLIILGEGNWHGSLPMDWISPEWFGFLAYYGMPHLILARALLYLGLSNYLASPLSDRNLWFAGLYILILGLVHPLSMVTAFAILAVHQIGIWIAAVLRKSWQVLRKWFWIGVRVILLPTPLAVYYFIRFSTDPYLKLWTDQNRILSPHPCHLLASFGLVFIPALLGVSRLLKRWMWSGLLLLAWLIAFPLFAYAPHNLQRRLPEGIWIAWLILAALGLSYPFAKKSLAGRRWGAILFGLSILTPVLLITSGIGVALKLDPQVFLPADEVAVFEWLQYKARSGTIVLSSFATGNALPAWAPVRVVVGHGPESVHLDLLLPEVEAFYSGEMDLETQMNFLKSNDVDYIFYGPEEREMGSLDLDKLPSYELKVEIGDYQLFELIDSDG